MYHVCALTHPNHVYANLRARGYINMHGPMPG